MRQYLVLKADPRLREAQKNPSDLIGVTLERLRSLGPPGDLLGKLDEKFLQHCSSAVGRLSLDRPWRSRSGRGAGRRGRCPTILPILSGASSCANFWCARTVWGKSPEESERNRKEHWSRPILHLCSHVSVAPSRPFGKRSRVREMMGIDALHGRGYKGSGVNVVIIDRGLNKAEIPASSSGELGRRFD